MSVGAVMRKRPPPTRVIAGLDPAIPLLRDGPRGQARGDTRNKLKRRR